MNTEYIGAAAGVIVVFAVFLFLAIKIILNKKQSQMPYRKKYLLTKNEWAFYKRLKPVADKYSLGIIAKMRLADLVEVDTSKTKEYGKYFSKISSKHIDFGLIDPENMEVLFLIELDDRSHQRKDRIERDEFVNGLCKKTGYILIRTHGDVSDVESVIKCR